MAKFQSPLLGYNNNVRHRGRVFHIQTEDSGVNHPHIITHLFMDGGRILKSVKRSYAEHVGSENMSETVRVLMKEQHKAMFLALREGQFDELLDGPKKSASEATVAPTPAAAPKADVKPPTNANAAKPEAKPEAKAEAKPNDPAKAEAKPNDPAKAEAKPNDPAKAEARPNDPAKAEAKPNATKPEAEPETKPNATKPEAKPNDAARVHASTPRAPVAAPAAELVRSPPVPPPSGPDIAVNTIAAAPVVKVSSDQLSAARPASATVAGARPSPITRPGLTRSYTPEDAAPATIDEGRRPVLPHYVPDPDPPLPPELEALLRDELSPPPAPATARSRHDAEPKTTREPERRRSAQELTLDFDALERDSGPSPIFQQSDLPPPPKNLFAKEPRTGTYSAVETEPRPEPSRIPAHGSQAPSARAPQQPPVRPPTSISKTSEGRYTPARPAAIAGAAAKQPSPSSIFSDDLVSDKSLDEVILSYLAEDLEPPHRK